MTDRIRLTMPIIRVLDGTTFTIDFACDDRESDAPSAPAGLEFRVDCLTTNAQVQDWTTITAGESGSIALASTCNAILSPDNQIEVKQITVMADRGQTFQCSAQAQWKVYNANLQS